MVAGSVLSESDVHQHLKNLGFKKTEHTTATTTVWENDGDHILLPESIDGFYPNWLIADLLAKLAPFDPLFPPKPTH